MFGNTVDIFNYLKCIVLIIMLSGCSRSDRREYIVSPPTSPLANIITNGPHLSYIIPSNANVIAVGAGSSYSRILLYEMDEQRIGVRKWWKNGKMAEETPMQNGRPHGVMRFWRDNGQLLSESPYAEGKLHGVSKGWNVSGSIVKEIPYRQGQKHGVAREWDTDGTLVEQIWFFQGQKHGPASFDMGKANLQGLRLPVGKGIRYWFYVDGQEVSEAEYISVSQTNATLPKIERRN